MALRDKIRRAFVVGTAFLLGGGGAQAKSVATDSIENPFEKSEWVLVSNPKRMNAGKLIEQKSRRIKIDGQFVRVIEYRIRDSRGREHVLRQKKQNGAKVPKYKVGENLKFYEQMADDGEFWIVETQVYDPFEGGIRVRVISRQR